MADAIRSGGGVVVDLDEAEALIWYHAGPELLAEAVKSAPASLRWISLPAAGIDRWVDVVDDEHLWTAAKGVYAAPVAEMALSLGLAGLRNVAAYARANAWSRAIGRNLLGANVTIVGGGGIATSLIELLVPFQARITVVRRSPAPMGHVAEVVGPDRINAALTDACLVVVAAALTTETIGMLGTSQFDSMPSEAWLVNVARGPLVVTDDLVVALESGSIGGAALDVTDPEPLPAEHRLWQLPNCLITPHAGNTADMHRPLLMGYITDNVRRFGARQELFGLVDPALGY